MIPSTAVVSQKQSESRAPAIRHAVNRRQLRWKASPDPRSGDEERAAP